MESQIENNEKGAVRFKLSLNCGLHHAIDETAERDGKTVDAVFAFLFEEELSLRSAGKNLSLSEPPKQPWNSTLTICFSRDLNHRVKKAAKELGLQRSEFCRLVLTNRVSENPKLKLVL